MDILSLIKPEDLQIFTEQYDYQASGFMGQSLFPSRKVDNVKYAYLQLAEGQGIPVTAPVHAFDTEAVIGDRPIFEQTELESLFIKKKLDTNERIQYFLRSLGGRDSEVVNFVFNDAANLLSSVITRTEVMNMELLSTGKITVKENNLDKTIDYGVKAANKVNFTGWSNATHDIIGDLNKVIAKARKLGFKIVRAITSSKVVGYLVNNEAIQNLFARSMNLLTEDAVIAWVLANFGIEFVINDDVYKDEHNSNEVHRFYKDDAITFLSTRGALGAGLFGYTPEELELSDTSESNLVTLTMWKEKDPVKTWTKASALYIPAIANLNQMIIATVA